MMSTPTVDNPERIFISYRRDDTSYPAGWLFDRLVSHFGRDKIFKDVDSIEPGDDFVDVITNAVGCCDVLLALIGDKWLTITDTGGRRRLDDPHDFVRLEIEAALTREVRVIPILVEGAKMPRADELPASLAKLVRLQALELSPVQFDSDTGRLLQELDRTLKKAPGHSAEEQTQHEAGEAANPPIAEQARRALHPSEANAEAGTRTLITPQASQDPTQVLSRRRRRYVIYLVSSLVLFIVSIVGAATAPPNSGWSALSGGIFLISVAGALVSLGFLLFARRRNRA